MEWNAQVGSEHPVFPIFRAISSNRIGSQASLALLKANRLASKAVSLLTRLVGQTILRSRTRQLLRIIAWAYARHRNEIASLPPRTIRALVLAEDHRFYFHYGLDPIAMLRALYRTLACGHVEGGSTLEQQCARTICHLRGRTVGRKITEIILATMISSVVPKRHVPGLYLCTAYYGYGLLGLDTASRHLTLDTKTIGGSARLVAHLRYPWQRKEGHPFRALAARRAEYVKALLVRDDRDLSCSESSWSQQHIKRGDMRSSSLPDARKL